MFSGVIRHGTLVTVITLIFAVIGAVAALRIPIQMIPDLETRTITVETRWPGATPQDIEKEILIEQEQYLRNVPNLSEMVSSASSGSAEIELEFPFGVDITETLIQVNNALSQVPDYLSVRRESGSKVIQIKRLMLAEVARINSEVLEPEGMKLALTADDARYVQASIANVWTNLGIGAAFATLVMFLFLRSGRATLTGVIGIPLCAIAAFLGLMITGRTINVISLAGVAFAIGMTVDNSIVVLENIERHRRLGLDRFESAPPC